MRLCCAPIPVAVATTVMTVTTPRNQISVHLEFLRHASSSGNIGTGRGCGAATVVAVDTVVVAAAAAAVVFVTAVAIVVASADDSRAWPACGSGSLGALRPGKRFTCVTNETRMRGHGYIHIPHVPTHQRQNM